MRILIIIIIILLCFVYTSTEIFSQDQPLVECTPQPEIGCIGEGVHATLVSPTITPLSPTIESTPAPKGLVIFLPVIFK